MDLTDKLRNVLKLSTHQRERIAATLEVSTSTIDRWAANTVVPQPTHAKALHDLLQGYDSSPAQGKIAKALTQCLGAAREIMHRYGAASSRNDALDQISLLLSVHLQLRRSGMNGLQEIAPSALSESLRVTIEELQAGTPQEVHERFVQSGAILSRNQSYLTELVEALSSALDEIDVTENWRRPHEFHEVFVNFLASSFHEEKEFAQYMTPREIVDFMVRVGCSLLDPKITHPKVLDPSCGTGSFLTSFAEIFAERIELTEGEVEKKRWWHESAPSTLIGIDTSERMVRLAASSFVTAGLNPRSIFLDSSLDPQTESVTALLASSVVDLILTNPPFGAEHSRGQHGSGRIPSELIYIERYIEWLRPGGVALTIMPDSVLTNRGLFAQTRTALLKAADVAAVISLPPVTFAASGTTTKTSILVIRKKDGTNSRPGFFAVANHVGFDVSTRGSIRRRVANGRNDLPAIADALLFSASPSDVGVYRVVDHSLERWDAQFLNSSLVSKVEGTVSSNCVRVADVADLVRDRADPRRTGSDTFSYIEISNVDGNLLRVSASEIPVSEAPSRARRRVKSGDVLVSTVRPERRTIGVVPPHLDGAICSTGFAVIRTKTISPYILAAAMRSQNATAQLIGISSGVAYPAFDAELLPTIEIDLKEQTWQEKCVEFGRALNNLEILRSEVLAAT